MFIEHKLQFEDCRLRNARLLLVTASVVPNSPILVTLMMKALSSSETLVLARATRCNIPEAAILHDSGLHVLQRSLQLRILSCKIAYILAKQYSSTKSPTFRCILLPYL
jgi:hypothetical protein